MSIAHARLRRGKRGLALAAVASGRLPLREALWDPHKALWTCPVHRVVSAAPGMGFERTRKVMERAGVYALIPLGQLNEMQRQAILNELPRRVK